MVKIYIHGLSKEEYAIQQKDHLDDEYVKRRLAEYDKADEIYYNQWLDFDHVMVNNDDMADMKLQIDNIMRFYEQGRKLSIEKYRDYMNSANKHISKFARGQNLGAKEKNEWFFK